MKCHSVENGNICMHSSRFQEFWTSKWSCIASSQTIQRGKHRMENIFFFKSWINFYLIKMVLRSWCWNGALNCYLWMKSTKNICFTSWFIEVDMILFSKLGHFHLCSFCANKILISICSMQIENVQIHKHWWFDDVLGLFKFESMQS